MDKRKPSIVKNYLYSAAYSSMKILFSIILVPYVSRVLKPEGMGQAAYAQNIASYFILAASLGIPDYGVREIAKSGESVEDRSRVFFEIFRINAVSSLILSAVYYFAVFHMDFFAEKRMLYCIAGISIVFNACNIDWFYKGMEQFSYITRRSYAVKLLSTAAVFLLVRSEGQVALYALIVTLGLNANYLLNMIHVGKYIRFPEKKLHSKRHLKVVFCLFAAQAAGTLYEQLDTTMVGLLCGDRHVGYYVNVMKVIRVLTLVITALGSVLLPRFSALCREGDKGKLEYTVKWAYSYILTVSVPCAAGLFLEAEDFVRVLFGEAFLPAVRTMRILVFLIPVLSVSTIFGTQLLMALNQEKKLAVSVMAGAIVNLLLNSFLIRRFMQNGAAVASVIAESVVMALQLFFVSPCLKISLHKRLLLKVIVQTACMAAAVLPLNRICGVLAGGAAAGRFGALRRVCLRGLRRFMQK